MLEMLKVRRNNVLVVPSQLSRARPLRPPVVYRVFIGTPYDVVSRFPSNCFSSYSNVVLASSACTAPSSSRSFVDWFTLSLGRAFRW